MYFPSMTLFYGLLKTGGAVAVAVGIDLFMYTTDCLRVYVEAWWLPSSVMDDGAPLHEGFSHTQQEF